MHDATDIRAQLEEERRLIDAYPYDYLVVEAIPETGERGIIAYEPDDEYGDQLVLSHVVAGDLGAPTAERLAHSWNALPVRNAQIEAVLELHKPDEDGEECSGCMNAYGDPCRWPCPTVTAIEEAGKA